ncbi:MAG: GGDEF domain-containing protein, partial [Betaproteobacteria bacterium]|nr:GGDEF domain-containing protein [Betaproteobacteria bacterium]
FGLMLAATAQERARYAFELASARNLWQKTHEGLRHGNREMRLSGDNNPAVQLLYEEMDPYYRGIIASVAAILDMQNYEDDRSRLLELVNAIHDNEIAFLNYMDKIVLQYDQESNTKLFRLQLIEGVILAVALFALIFEWRVVFKPAQKEIKAGFDVMKKNEAYLNQLFETTPTVTILFDAASLKAIKYNAMAVKRIQRWLGIALTAESSFADILPGPDGDRDLSRRLLAKIEEEKEFSNLEVGITEKKIVLMSAQTTTAGDKKLYLIGLSDITTLKHMATFDNLTTMLNRRAGLELLEYLFDQCVTLRTGMALCFIDIDGLKRVNDLHGHQEGDWYIQTVAQILYRMFGEACKGIRYGGDELILVTEELDLHLEEKMLQIDEILYRMGHEAFKPYTMSISHGFAVYPNDTANNVYDLIEEADMNMYEHKKAKKAHRPPENI